MQSETFLSEFPPITTEQWGQAIRESIGGQNDPAKIVWHPEPGLNVKPYYRAEDVAGLSFLDTTPGEPPYVRGTRSLPGWRIRESIDLADPEAANRKARETVAAGAEEIAFIQPRIETSSDIALLLADLNTPVHFTGLGPDAVTTIARRLQKSPYPGPISSDLDPLENPEFAKELLQQPPSSLRPFTILAEPFHESGTSSIEEIGFTISAGVETLAQMQERGISIDRAAQSIAFSFSIGSEFYIQIAKLRAFRTLWYQVIEAFHGDPEYGRAVVHAGTAQWNKTVYDPHVNILRSTTEAISAVLGGVDSISITAFDDCYRSPEESSRRLARNTQLILRHEAQLARVADPAGGSYLIEAITNSIACNAWKFFQEIERAGGFLKARESGFLPSLVRDRERSRQDAVAQRRLVLTGTNRFADASEKALGRVDPVRGGALKRVATGFEDLRLRTEHAVLKGVKPRIILAELGDLKMRTARSQFVGEFLGCAGLSARTHVFGAAAEVAMADADAVILCSSDPEYRAIADELMPGLCASGEPKFVLIAGNPRDREQLMALGVSDFIHIGCDAVAVLSRLQQQIGIGD